MSFRGQLPGVRLSSENDNFQALGEGLLFGVAWSVVKEQLLARWAANVCSCSVSRCDGVWFAEEGDPQLGWRPASCRNRLMVWHCMWWAVLSQGCGDACLLVFRCQTGLHCLLHCCSMVCVLPACQAMLQDLLLCSRYS
jgi:hypothetical protein